MISQCILDSNSIKIIAHSCLIMVDLEGGIMSIDAHEGDDMSMENLDERLS
jgi:hypothetical protein